MLFCALPASRGQVWHCDVSNLPVDGVVEASPETKDTESIYGSEKRSEDVGSKPTESAPRPSEIRERYLKRIEVLRKARGTSSALSQLESVAGSSESAAQAPRLEDSRVLSRFETRTRRGRPVDEVAVPPVPAPRMTKAQKRVCRKIARQREKVTSQILRTARQEKALQAKIAARKKEEEEKRAKVAQLDAVYARVAGHRRFRVDVFNEKRNQAVQEQMDMERMLEDLAKEAERLEATAKELRVEYQELNERYDAVRRDPALAETSR